MARMARIVVPDYPHHVVQRGNRRQRTFFSPADYRAYIRLIAKAKSDAEVKIWAYCLMPNHVHLIAVPGQVDSLAVLFRDAHQRYTRRINSREDWRGHLWQERFHSFVMDEEHLLAAVRYVEMNPVRAGLCTSPNRWPWSSVHAHFRRQDDAIVSVAPMLERVSNWENYLLRAESEVRLRVFRKHAKTGRPVGDDTFIAKLECLTGRKLRKKKPGRKAGTK